MGAVRPDRLPSIASIGAMPRRPATTGVVLARPDGASGIDEILVFAAAVRTSTRSSGFEKRSNTLQAWIEDWNFFKPSAALGMIPHGFQPVPGFVRSQVTNSRSQLNLCFEPAPGILPDFGVLPDEKDYCPK